MQQLPQKEPSRISLRKMFWIGTILDHRKIFGNPGLDELFEFY